MESMSIKTKKKTGVPDMQERGIKVQMLYLYVLNRGGCGKRNIVNLLSSTLSQLSVYSEVQYIRNFILY